MRADRVNGVRVRRVESSRPTTRVNPKLTRVKERSREGNEYEWWSSRKRRVFAACEEPQGYGRGGVRRGCRRTGGGNYWRERLPLSCGTPGAQRV